MLLVFRAQKHQTHTRITRTVKKVIIYLIEEKGVNWFMFGNESTFDDFCFKTVTELQKKYPHVKRAYIRSKQPYLTEKEKEYYLNFYEDTLMPSNVKTAGKFSYVERNQAMINASDFCVFYYNPDYKPPARNIPYQPNSGTRLAYEYAVKTGKKSSKTIINIFTGRYIQ